MKISVKQTFGFDSEMQIDAFSKKNEYVPKIDADYKFDKDTTLAIIAGFAFNKRVLIQGYHGTGKSTHIEQVAARLNWPCIRVNLDSHISRIDLIGKDAIVLKDNKQITEFKEGILPWSIQNPSIALTDMSLSRISFAGTRSVVNKNICEPPLLDLHVTSGSLYVFIFLIISL